MSALDLTILMTGALVSVLVFIVLRTAFTVRDLREQLIDLKFDVARLRIHDRLAERPFTETLVTLDLEKKPARAEVQKRMPTEDDFVLWRARCKLCDYSGPSAKNEIDAQADADTHNREKHPE